MGRGSHLPDLVVFHPDGAAARATIERLSRAGVDGGAIELMGRVEVTTAGRHGDRQVDLGSTLALGGRAVRGLLLGAPPGAVFGGIVMVLATQPSWPIVLAGAGGGAMFGAAVGILTALLAAPTMASSWERTFAPLVPGGVVVGIRVADQRCRRRAMRALSGAPPGSVRQIDDLDGFPDEPLDLRALDD